MADYQDEHLTSTQAAEMLERETVERHRLEKELKDLQVCDYSFIVIFSHCVHRIVLNRLVAGGARSFEMCLALRGDFGKFFVRVMNE